MKDYPKLPVLKAMLVAGLVAAPALAFAQRDGTPGNPAGTAVGRALDGATGTETRPDGTQGNPPGTAVGRALDRATGTPTQPDGVGNNPPGTALDRAAERAGQAIGQAVGQPAGSSPAAIAAPGSAIAGQPRASKLIGANVYNENNESIGEVNDILLTYGGGGPTAVLSVGGFLGIGDRLVTVPLAELKWSSERERVVLAGATKDSLKSRPEFRYDQLTRR